MKGVEPRWTMANYGIPQPGNVEQHRNLFLNWAPLGLGYILLNFNEFQHLARVPERVYSALVNLRNLSGQFRPLPCWSYCGPWAWSSRAHIGRLQMRRTWRWKPGIGWEEKIPKRKPEFFPWNMGFPVITVINYDILLFIVISFP